MESAVELARTSLHEARPRDNGAISFSQFLSLFHEDVPFELKAMGMEEVRQVECTEIAITLYCHKFERLYHRLFHTKQSLHGICKYD